eukprot:TRINITY_DN8887_c0_g1_i1.p1 TRINITY_DN8887_c0_g1~~TRINITY_DN8887_c0_g1_i1.p1  ORF type:complete len:188 (+),score=57.41 TRINITY_DN8887_c0_g1_i1:28-564(+)
MSKTFHTALIVMPPESLWSPIQSIRSIHDPAFKRWMPHINLIYPFDFGSDIERAAQIISEITSSIGQFEVTLNSIDAFNHKDSSTIFVKPDSKSTKNLQSLQSKIVKAFPSESKSRNRQGFNPHLTIAKTFKNNVNELKMEFGDGISEIKFDVDRVYLIVRDDTTPFKIHSAHELAAN